MKRYLLPILAGLLVLSLGLNLFLLMDREPEASLPIPEPHPSLTELNQIQKVIFYTLQGLEEADREAFVDAKSYAELRGLLDSVTTTQIDENYMQIVVGIRGLTREKEEAFRRFVYDGDFIRFVNDDSYTVVT